MRISGLLAFLAACGAESSEDKPASSAPLLHVDSSGVLRDSDERQVLLRGVNARVNGLFDVTFDDGRSALEEIPVFTGEDCRFLSEQLGLNLLRLPVNWSGIEPQPDQWDDAYLDRIGELVDDCAAVGVWTIVDLHQDAYGKDIGEDGAPAWAILPPPEALLEGPLTSEELARRRVSPDVLAAFASLYSNAPMESGEGVRDAYAEMAGVLAARLADHPGAVALELHNEPVTGGNQALLDDFHDAVAEAVRAKAPALPIVFEPDALRNLTDSIAVERPWAWGDGIYGPHIYTDVFEDGWDSENTDDIRASVAAADDEASDHASHLFVGEFGHDPRTDRGKLYIDTCLDAFDEHAASWAIWLYEEHSQDAWGLWDEGAEAHTRGDLRQAAADQLARPFPIAVDGTLQTIDYDPEARVLTVRTTGGSGGMLLSAPRRTFPEGVTATCDESEVTVTIPAAGRAEVTCAGELVVSPS